MKKYYFNNRRGKHRIEIINWNSWWKSGWTIFKRIYTFNNPNNTKGGGPEIHGQTKYITCEK